MEIKAIPQKFLNVTTKDISKISQMSSLPLVVKGIMAEEDAELAIESGGDGIVVSNHGGRVMDRGQASLEVLPDIAKHLKSKKRTKKCRDSR